MHELSLGLKSQELGKPIPEIDIYLDRILGLLASYTQLYARFICHWSQISFNLK